MGRKSSLTEEQWLEVERRHVLEGESINSLAARFGVNESSIRRRIKPKKAEAPAPENPLKKLAADKVRADAESRRVLEQIAELPYAKQAIVEKLAKKLENVSEHLASAAEKGAASAHRLSLLASQQLDLVDDVDPKANRLIRLTRMVDSGAVGAGGYRGNCATEAQDQLGGLGWPASVLLKGRMENTGSGLPGATKNVGWQILLPASIPIIINASDTLVDDLGRRYAVQGAEQTDMGWRLTTVEEHL